MSTLVLDCQAPQYSGIGIPSLEAQHWAASGEAVIANSRKTRKIIADNIKLLLKRHEWSEHKLAKESGVAQKTINKTINLKSSPTTDTIERLAGAFGLTAWHLMLPNFAGHLLSSPSLDKLVEYYLRSSDTGRGYITRVAEKEADYENSHTNDNNHDHAAGTG